MTENLPPSIRSYFAGKNARDVAMAVSGFSRSAVVTDEGRDHAGAAAIRAWIEETSERYHDKAAIRSVAAEANRLVVTAEISGIFPNSPVVLRFGFTLEDDRIVRLEIAP